MLRLEKKKGIYTCSICDGCREIKGKHLAEQHASLPAKKKTTKKNKTKPLKRLAYKNTRMNILFLTFKRKHH